jgi:uncharacterized protein (DUF362 family)/Pyruvate/2-oxoacid:ferredoxin oxidoreductase delta subunit
MSNVSLVKCTSYEQKEVDKAVARAIKLLGGIDKFVKKGSKVLLKPNMLGSAKREQRVTTDPAVVEAVIKILKKKKCTIYLGDSPALGSAVSVADSCAIKVVCDKYKVKIIEFFPSEKFINMEGRIVKDFTLPSLIKDIDVIINLPKLKTHGFTTFTGAVKNLFGMIPGLQKASYHLRLTTKEEFSTMLLDLYGFLKPSVKLNIMDGIIGMEGNGPQNGNPKKADFILASSDAISLDCVACELISIPKDNVFTNFFGGKRKLGTSDLENIKIIGDKFDDLKTSFEYVKSVGISERLPKFLMNFLKNKIVAKPIIDKNKCLGCKNCFNICPPKTIKMKSNKAVINYNNCIRCYCCHEVCPYKAIDLKEPLMTKILKEIMKFYLKNKK